MDSATLQHGTSDGPPFVAASGYAPFEQRPRQAVTRDFERDRDASSQTLRHIIPISGKDSLATAIWQTELDPNLPYEFVYNDTSAELPETYEWLDRVETTLGIKILRIGKSLEKVIEEQGILPSARTRFCTKYSKIFPMRDFIGDGEAVVYFGLRADEQDRAGALQTKTLKPRYPLREAGIGLATVYKLVGDRDLMPPAFLWQRLFVAVIDRTGGLHGIGMKIVNEWPEWVRDRVFAWRSRPNCFFCFFQRRYEWVGLLEHHPPLFEKAERIEGQFGDGEDMRREGGFFWIGVDYPLSKIREKAAEIFEKRVSAICKLIAAQQQGQLFADSLDEIDIAGTSCGLLCGK